MGFLSSGEWSAEAREFLDSLERGGAFLNLSSAAVVDALRQDVARVVRDMDDPDREPPMIWSGVPVPTQPVPRDSDWCLTLSTGGTNTNFLLARLRDGEPEGIDENGNEVRGEELERARGRCAMATPTKHTAANGHEMVAQLAEQIAGYLEKRRDLLPGVKNIVLSWCFAHRVVRTAPHVLGGVSALTTLMTKDQDLFTHDLTGIDIGELFAAAIETRLGWSRPVTASNDGVMALHYFFAQMGGEDFAQRAVFINGTGNNFCIAEPYVVRPDGIVSRGSDYEPPLKRKSPQAPGSVEAFLVDYESGRIDVKATATDLVATMHEDFERVALSGGFALENQFRCFVRLARDEEFLPRFIEDAEEALEGAGEGGALVHAVASMPLEDFGGTRFSREDLEILQIAARATIDRSAIHAAMILAAATQRTGFGLGHGPVPDLLGMEGSVWRAFGYPERVRHAWETLVAQPLHVEFRAEPKFAASAWGPLYFGLLHANEEA
ncbi:MAG: hypothetical protein AAF517_06470 [Planctomycetota bacterium]